MKKTQRIPQHMWTKKEIENLIDVWDKKSVAEIAEKMDIEQSQVGYMVHQVRSSGIKLTKKKRLGRIRSLILEIKEEQGL